VAENGQPYLPIELRRAIGFKTGGPMTIEIEDDKVRLLTIAVRVSRALDRTRSPADAHRGRVHRLEARGSRT
jgi:bifunctional DNA-binding transcriptional regulator/antitoxin component of YhaV-PrlF toxin-antitoxin module